MFRFICFSFILISAWSVPPSISAEGNISNAHSFYFKNSNKNTQNKRSLYFISSGFPPQIAQEHYSSPYSEQKFVTQPPDHFFRAENRREEIDPLAGRSVETKPSWRRELCAEKIPSMVRRSKERIINDFKNFHTKDVFLNYGLAVAGCGILANTKMDLKFQNWYRKDVRCGFTDEFSEFSKVFGEGKIFIPVAVTSAVVYRLHQEYGGPERRDRPVGNFFDRTARGYAAGTPTLLVSQILLGGDRPRGGSSYWKPFQEDHGVSGHAYIGAVPFLTAAEMAERIWVKGVFYSLSIIPAWSRVNDDAHYLSQAVLGWYLAYLSVRAVSATEGTKPFVKGLTVFPVTEQNGVGLGILFRR